MPRVNSNNFILCQTTIQHVKLFNRLNLNLNLIQTRMHKDSLKLARKFNLSLRMKVNPIVHHPIDRQHS